MLFFQGGEPFAVGVMDYEFRPVTPGDINTRIILRINVESIPALAVMDTGAPYLVIAPAVADRLGFNLDHSLDRTDITIRGEKYSGNLYRVDVELTALEGLSTTFQATAFVPDLDQVDKWGNLPTFLGIESCLERIRFALDPSTSRFYFGALP